MRLKPKNSAAKYQIILILGVDCYCKRQFCGISPTEKAVLTGRKPSRQLRPGKTSFHANVALVRWTFGARMRDEGAVTVLCALDGGFTTLPGRRAGVLSCIHDACGLFHDVTRDNCDNATVAASVHNNNLFLIEKTYKGQW